MKIKRVAIIGVGLMGASLALALKNKFPGISVSGYARSKRSFVRLKKINILTKVSCDLKEVVSGADLVVLAAPVFAIIDMFKQISPFLKREAIVIDLGSTKKLIEQRAKRLLPKHVSFIGCHPLCGSHKRGAENADKDLYKEAICIITSSTKASKTIKRLWQDLGCRVYCLDSSLHDKILSYVSHLPHVISFSLTSLVARDYIKFTSGSFRDLTRISSSSPQLWADIFLSNKSNLIRGIREYIKILKGFANLIKGNNKTAILKLIEEINRKQKAYR